MGMKIFKLDVGETDWVYAPDMLEALKFYNRETGNGLDEIESIEEVPEEKWDSITVRNEDDGQIYTFKEITQGEVESFIIASTAY